MKRNGSVFASSVLAGIALTALGCLAPARAAPATVTASPALAQNFDEQIPGDVPTSWARLWGNQGDDQFVVSNMKSVSGKHSLLLDRQTGTNTEMWGFGRPLPAMDDGWYVMRFDFCVDGAGSDVRLGFELRAQGGAPERACALSLDGLALNLQSSDSKHAVQVGQIVAGTWYRVTLWTPTSKGNQSTAYATLERFHGATWKPEGTVQSVPAVAPKGGYGYLEVNTAPEKRGFDTYVDDVLVEQRVGNHP